MLIQDNTVEEQNKVKEKLFTFEPKKYKNPLSEIRRESEREITINEAIEKKNKLSKFKTYKECEIENIAKY